MAENIELRTFNTSHQPDGDVEEYYEIKHDGNKSESLDTATFISKFCPQAINEYDFFTKDSKKNSWERKKKKKRKKSDKPSNIMDIISTELASLTAPVTETVIETAEDRSEYQSVYVQSYSREQRKYQRKKAIIDSEYGHSRAIRAQQLCPLYPNLLENYAEDAQSNDALEFTAPSFFSDLIKDYNDQPQKQSIRFLDIEIKDLHFKHHHNFSLENVLSMKLVETYKEYEEIEERLNDLSHEIKVNRETKDNLTKDLMKISPNKKNNLRFDATIRKYAGQLLKLKENHTNLIEVKKKLTHNIISLWADIEMIREKLKCYDSPYVLKIDKQILSKSEYEKEWNNLYEKEWTDYLTKIEYDYGTKYIEYKELKKEQRDKSRTELSKPKLEIDEDTIRVKVEEIVNKLITRDVHHVQLEKDEKHDTKGKLLRHIFHFEIYIDKLFVCETEQRSSIDKWYNVIFDEYLSVEILEQNEILRIVLMENEEYVAEVQEELCNLKRRKNNSYETLKFVYNKDIVPTAEFVGSGNSIKDISAINKVRLKSGNMFKENLVTTCEVNVKIQWRQNIEETQNEAIKISWDTENKLKRLMHGMDKPNVDVLCDMIGKVYGKDVTNDEAMLNTLKTLCKLEPKSKAEEFELNENSAELVRLKLLHLRNIGGFTDIENKLVPIHGSQITTEQLNCLQKTKEKEFDIDYLRDKEVDMDPVELQRFIGVKFIQKLNKKMLRNLNEHLMVKTRKDVVRENREFSWRSLFSRDNNTSPLQVSNGTKQQILMQSLTKEQEIHVTVKRAFNLMDRSADFEDDAEISEDTLAGYRVRGPRAVTRAEYRGQSAVTVTALGSHPTWNHSLKLTAKLDPLSNLRVDIFDCCKLHVSDGNESATLGRTVHYRHFNKWLGSVHVPIFAVLSLGSLRGTFKINSPLAIFGYEPVQNSSSQSLVPDITRLLKKQTSYIALHITTSLSHLGGFQDFTQPLPANTEDDYIIKHLNNFVTDFVNEFPNRHISLTFIDSAGKNKCVTQFLQPIPLPDREFFPKNPKSCGSALSKSSVSTGSGRKREGAEAYERDSEYSHESSRGDGLMKTIHACLRYVALIPCYDVAHTHVVTLMGLELLKLLHGSPLDHAILLSSYFLYLGIKSWLCIGLGLPAGRSCYVLIQYDLSERRFVLTSDVRKSRGILNRNAGYVWYVCDAVSGERHELRDVGCPLKTVELLFDTDNIWVNVQSSLDIENVSFDLSKSSDWQTVFDKNIFVMKQPIVNDSQFYAPPCSVEALRQSLEDKIKLKVQKWRPHMKTIWNRYCSGVLRDALPHWEYWSFYPDESKPAYSHKIKQLMATYRMYGFPLNLPFVSTRGVVSAVKSAGIYLTDDPAAEFALAVQIFSYPNNVLSVWLYIATLNRL